MIISKELLLNWTSLNFIIESKYLVLLAVIHLHKDGHINDEKFKALAKQFNNNTLCRKVNTHHCKITDEWYNDDGTGNILVEAWRKKCNPEDLDIETALKYFNKVLNRNRNFCLDFLYFQYLKPIIQRCEYSYDYGIPFRILKSMKIDFPGGMMSYDEFEDTWQATSGYCCKDCDGCLGEYKRMQYRSYIGSNMVEKLSNHIKSILNNMKTESGLKNPHNKLANA